MRIKHLLLIVCVLLSAVSAALGQNNIITIPDVSVANGKTISLPVNMDNSADVVAVQFTLTVPDGLSINASSAALSDRSDNHSVTFRSIGGNKYMAMIFSSQNKAIKGRTGKLMSVSLTASNTLEEGTEHQLVLSDCVIGARDGSNLITGFTAGKVTIAKSPDLEVSEVSVKETTLNPGGKVNVSWTVSNKGGMPTTGGWSEQIILKDMLGATKLLGTLYHDGTLNAGATVSGSAEVNVPHIIGMDGNCRIEVRVVPESNTGEPSWLRDNNTAETANTFTVNKLLVLSPENANADESNPREIRFQLSRSGSTANEEIFSLTRNADERIVLPESITIEKNQSSTYFYAKVVANKTLDNDSIVRMSVSSNAYYEVSSVIRIEDDTYPSLSISTEAQDVTEGGTIKFTVSTTRASQSDIEVKMTCDHASKFNIPSSIIIPAGKTSVEVTVEAVEDDVPNVEEVVTFNVTAARHNPASIYTTLVDNDVPTLQLVISPAAVSEGAGPLAVTATLRRTDNIDKVVTVKLSDDSNGGIYYGLQEIKMEKGVEEVTVNLGPIDNAIVDGERTYNISAAVWIASCSCNANNGSSGGVVSVPLTVYDNDGPTLTLTSASSVLKEGGEISVTVKRNTDTANPLTVNISSDHDADMEYPSTVTIPAGQTETTFTVKSKDNDITGDGFTAVLKAMSEGYATGNVWFAVSDQTLPDAQVQSFASAENSYIHGDEMVFNTTLLNSGNAELPASTLVQLYESDSHDAIADFYTISAIPAGETIDIKMSVKGVMAIGKHSFYAKVNPNKGNSELDYNNNSSSFFTIDVVSPFSTSTAVSKTVLGKSEEVVISGKASGRNVANTDIDVYLINHGYRQIITTTTNAQGEFSVKYKPFENQNGHFVVGSCFHGEKTDVEQCTFDVYGFDVKNSSLTCDVLKGDSFIGSFELTNNGVLPLNNVKASVVAQLPNAEVTFSDAPVNIAGGESKEISYTVRGVEVSPKLEWQTLKVEFTCDEGATETSEISFYIREPMAQLKSDVVSINTSVTIGSEREYRITLSNIGKGETGNITLATPSWMRVDGIQTISSLSLGESKEVALIISTNDKMQANVPITGNIAVNCDNGNGISIPFNVEPVSSSKGILSVDVCDEFTYYTSEAPHVSGAEVVIKHPTNGTVLASGTTNENGIFEVELPEGYYALSVTANKHKDESFNVYVDPERTRNVVVNMGYTAITYNWNVEETEVEDEYKLVTKVNYETNVPMPVVVLGVPEKIDGDNMKAGESTIIYITATNKGLITALNNQIVLPENTDEWKFEPLVSIEPADLPAQQSIVIPVRITRLKDGSEAKPKAIVNDMFDSFNNCMTHIKDTYEAVCGDELKNNAAVEKMSLKMCAVAATGAAIYNFLSSVFSGMPSVPLGNPIPAVGGSEYPLLTQQVLNMCDTCEAQKASDMIDVLLGLTPLGDINDALNDEYNMLRDARNQKQSNIALNDVSHRIGDKNHKKIRIPRSKLEQLRRSLEAAANLHDSFYDNLPFLDEPDLSKGIWSIVKILEISLRQCPDSDNENQEQVQSRRINKNGWQKDYDEVASKQVDFLKNFYNSLVELFGDETWFGKDIENKLAFAVAITENELTDEEIISMRPASVTVEQAIDLYKRLNGLDEKNTINYENFEELVDKNVAMNDAAVAEGYESLSDRLTKAYNICMEKYNEQSSSVCASITLQFSQRMVMTRQAFRGTLTVFNGNETTAMTDVKLSLTVKDEDGNVATSHEFQINPETLKGFNGNLSLEDGWTLDAQQTGVATIMFIPTKYAAPTVNKYYSFGGSLSYVDPFTGLTVKRDLAPVTLTVKPSPNLDLTYFMQRDIKGDDPLTEEVEPCEEAEFSLLINNTGYGDATNVRMYTDQPEIIDNEKGLKIDFELMSSQLNGGEKTLALGGTVETDFGTIPAKSTTYAQWWIKSSLLGHFTDYNVEATHVTSYGNPDLSLLNNVTIHELIRSLDVDEENGKLVGFMTNDIVDADDTPDMLYLSNGDIESVALAKNVDIQKINATDYAMTVSAGKPGWNYGNVSDPTYGVASLKSVVRQSDGKQMSLRNFWQTDRTLRDGKDPLYENKIHFADNMVSGNSETYILTFEPTPNLMLDVASIEGIPEEESLSVEPLGKVKVMFNKYVEPSTFTTDDISLAVQGIKQDVSSVAISTDDNKSFTLDFTSFNENVGNGYFVLTVNTAEVKDNEGYFGKNGKQAGWIMFRGGFVELTTSTYPESAGTVKKLSASSETKVQSAALNEANTAEYGSTLKLTTVANEGYEFSNWTVNGVEVSKDPILEYVPLGDIDVKANYVLKKYSVTINASEGGGAVEGSASGVYSHGDVLNITANANEDFVFDGWIVNDKNVSNESTISVVVDENKTINAEFHRDVFLQSLTMSRGWNWISSYVKEPVPVNSLFGSVTRIVGQFDEAVDDPVYGIVGNLESLQPGKAYKMEASYGVVRSFKGHVHNLAELPINLHTGWNWISYPCNEENNINDVLANATDGDYITSQYGFSEFANGYWEGTLNNLVPGYGYIYKSGADKALAFDFVGKDKPGVKESRVRHAEEDPYVTSIDVHKYPTTMNVIARVSDNNSFADNEKCRIYAFAGNECRGESRYVGGNHYLTIYGDEATVITFVVENIDNGDTFIAKEDVTFNQDVLGRRNAPFVITASETTGIPNVTSSKKMKIYTIDGVLIDSEATVESLKKLHRGVYIVNRQKFVVK